MATETLKANPEQQQTRIKSKRAGRLAELGLAAFVTTGSLINPTLPKIFLDLSEIKQTPQTQESETMTSFNLASIKLPTSETTQPIEAVKDSLDKTLTDFLSGKIKLKNSEKFIYADKIPAKLNIQNGNLDFLKQDNPPALYQAVLLGEEIINNHVIVYVGFQDVNGKNFFIPVNYGDITNAQYKRFFMKSGKEVFPTGNITGYSLSIKDTYALLQKHNKQAILINLYPDTNFKPPAMPTDQSDIYEFNAQGKTTDRFVRWSYNTTKKPYTKVPMSPEVKTIVNKRIKSFNAKSIPVGYQTSLFGDK